MQNEGVVKAARMTGYLHLVGDAQTGDLRPASGPEWAAMPLGSSRLSDAYMQHRFTHLQTNPLQIQPPDWTRLHSLRAQMRTEAARQREAERTQYRARKRRMLAQALAPPPKEDTSETTPALQAERRRRRRRTRRRREDGA